MKASLFSLLVVTSTPLFSMHTLSLRLLRQSPKSVVNIFRLLHATHMKQDESKYEYGRKHGQWGWQNRATQSETEGLGDTVAALDDEYALMDEDGHAQVEALRAERANLIKQSERKYEFARKEGGWYRQNQEGLAQTDSDLDDPYGFIFIDKKTRAETYLRAERVVDLYLEYVAVTDKLRTEGFDVTVAVFNQK